MHSNLSIKVWSHGKCTELLEDGNVTLGELKREVQGKHGKAKVSLFHKNMPIQGFNGFSLNLLSRTFGELYLVHDANQFKDMSIVARRQIRDELCASNNATSVPISIQFQLKNQFVTEKYLLSTVGRLDVLSSMCRRHVQYCAIAYENLYFPMAKFNGLDKLEYALPLLQEDGMLHVVASESYRYEFSDYQLQQLGQFDTNFYRRLSLYDQKNRSMSFMLIGRKVPMRILHMYFEICYDCKVIPKDEAYPLISDLDEATEEIELVVRQQRLLEISPTLQYTIAIGYREPLLYLIRKSNILIVYDVRDNFVASVKSLPVKESLEPYSERLPVMLSNSFLMSEILKSGVSVLEFTLEGKLIREIGYSWSPNYHYQLVCLDYITVKIAPNLTRNEIWRVHQPNDRLIFDADQDCKLFMSKTGHSHTSHLDLIAVYIPKRLELTIYSFSSKAMKFKLRLNSFITWVSFSLCGGYVMYSNDYQEIEQYELSTSIAKTRKRMFTHELHFYDQRRRLMCIKDNKLWVEGEKQGRSITMAVLLVNGVLCRVSEGDHLAKVLFM